MAPDPPEDDHEFEHPGAAAAAAAATAANSLTPKRKPLMSSLSANTPKEAKDNKMPSSSGKPRVAWALQEENGVFSPQYPDRSMQPPHHRGNAYNSHLRSAEKTQNSQSNNNNNNNSDQPYPAEAMEEEEMGTDYLSLSSLPLGSFAEDSPPRHHQKPDETSSSNTKVKQSPRSSPSSAYPRHPYGYPPHQHASYPHPPPPPPYYSKSPRSNSYPMYPYGAHPPHGPPPKGGHGAARGRGNPPPHYPYPPPMPGHPNMGYQYYPPPYPQPDHWTSPQAYDSEYGGKENAANNTDVKDAFPESPGSPRRSSSPSPPMEEDEHADGDTKNTTPEKVKMRSPFRSPPLSQTKKSPMFRSPGLGNYGSFGLMDTPGGTLAAEFSPMGPMLGRDPFGTGYPTPPQLSLSRSSSEDNMEDATRKDPHLATSPFSGFIQDFPFSSKNTAGSTTAASGGLQGVSRSPILSEKRSSLNTVSEPRADRSLPMSTSDQPNPRDEGTKISASPMGPASGTKPRKLWNGPSDSAPMRLELGSSSSLKKSFEGINSMMRASQPPPPMATPSTTSSRPPYSRLPPSTNYRRLNTPIKLDPSPVQTAKVVAAANNKRGLPASAKSTRESKLTRTGDKENQTTPGATKRSPCNCKKSRCLKLYCECFANELFCEGCNCTDCQNSTDFASVREKAMKDTRAKNPNAFKPRISVKGGTAVAGASPQSGHNMGCRCKRSECLKKYCECFQAGVMCGVKCKCVDCMNFAGSQKLIDKRRKIKDQRGAELAMKVAQDAWKGPHAQQSARKMVARPAVQGMRPMPSPMGTPSHGRMPPHLPPHMMPSPSHGHPYMRPYAWGYSPIGMPPHVSPSGYGMYHHHHPPPPPPPQSSAPHSAGKKSSPPSAAKSSRKAQMVNMEMPYAKAIASGKKTTPPKAAASDKAIKVEEGKETPAAKLEDKPDPPESTVQPTPAETKTAPAKITPCQATPAPAVRLSYKSNAPKAQPRCDAYFGDLPKLPETEAANIFSFLSEKDLASAAVISKLWNKVTKEIN